MHTVLGTCCCEAFFFWDVVCCWMLLTAKPNNLNLWNFCFEHCLWHSSWHGWFGWSIKGLAVLYVPRHAVKMGCQGLPWKFNIADTLQIFIFLEVVCPTTERARMSYVTPQNFSPLLAAGEQEVCQQLHVTIISCFSAWFSGTGGRKRGDEGQGLWKVHVCVGRERCTGTEPWVSAHHWTRAGQLCLGISCHVELRCLHIKEACCWKYKECPKIRFKTYEI